MDLEFGQRQSSHIPTGELFNRTVSSMSKVLTCSSSEIRLLLNQRVIPSEVSTFGSTFDSICQSQAIKLNLDYLPKTSSRRMLENFFFLSDIECNNVKTLLLSDCMLSVDLILGVKLEGYKNGRCTFEQLISFRNFLMQNDSNDTIEEDITPFSHSDDAFVSSNRLFVFPSNPRCTTGSSPNLIQFVFNFRIPDFDHIHKLCEFRYKTVSIPFKAVCFSHTLEGTKVGFRFKSKKDWSTPKELVSLVSFWYNDVKMGTFCVCSDTRSSKEAPLTQVYEDIPIRFVDGVITKSLSVKMLSKRQYLPESDWF